MKSLIAASVVALCLAAGSLWHSRYVDKTTDEIIAKTEDVASAVAAGDYQSAHSRAKILQDAVVREEDLLGVICDHKDYYEIKRTIGEMSAYIDKEDSAESMAHCIAIISMTERISEMSKPYISNIL